MDGDLWKSEFKMSKRSIPCSVLVIDVAHLCSWWDAGSYISGACSFPITYTSTRINSEDKHLINTKQQTHKPTTTLLLHNNRQHHTIPYHIIHTFNTTWKEGFERARRNLSSNFDVPEAYSLGKLIGEGKRSVAQLAFKHLGRYYRKVVKTVYLLHKGCEGQWETSLTPRVCYNMPTTEAHRRNKEKHLAQKISSE